MRSGVGLCVLGLLCLLSLVLGQVKRRLKTQVKAKFLAFKLKKLKANATTEGVKPPAEEAAEFVLVFAPFTGGSGGPAGRPDLL